MHVYGGRLSSNSSCPAFFFSLPEQVPHRPYPAFFQASSLGCVVVALLASAPLLTGISTAAESGQGKTTAAGAGAGGSQKLTASASSILKKALRLWDAGDRLGEEINRRFAAGRLDIPEQLELRNKQQALDDEAEKCFRSALKKAGKKEDGKSAAAVGVRAQYGLFLFSRKRYVEAQRELYAAWRSPRFTRVLAPVEQAGVLRGLGAVLERKGRYSRALSAYRDAVRAAPDDARNAVSLAAALCAVGRPEEAEAALSPWLNKLAVAGEQLKGAAEKGAAEKSVGTLPPPTVRACLFYLSGYTAEICNLREKAERRYARAAVEARRAGTAAVPEVLKWAEKGRVRVRRLRKRATPEERDRLRRAGVFFERALVYEKQARTAAANPALKKLPGTKNAAEATRDAAAAASPALQKAREMLRESVRERPRWARALLELGRLELRLGLVERAAEHLEAAALYDPYSQAAATLLAGTLLYAGEWERAEKLYAELARREPEFGPAHWGLAQAAVKLHRTVAECDKALAAADRAERCGVDLAPVLDLCRRATRSRDRLARGEKVPSEPRRRLLRRWATAKRKPVKKAALDPWKGTILDY